MKAYDTLYKLSRTSNNNKLNTLTRRGVFSSEVNAQIRTLTFQIKDNLTVDYCRQLNIKEIEIGILNEVLDEFIKTGKSRFDEHYIQLLCWNIYKLKPFTKRENGKKIKLSIFEYEPGLLELNPITKKLFQLFSKFKGCKEKISAALMMVYLNNYSYASEYYVDLLRQYLRSTKFSRNLSIFFDVTKAGTYGRWRIYNSYYKSFIRRIELFQIRSGFFNTKYFQDAWYFWMKNKANLTNKAIIEDLPCKFFEICSDAEKLLILSKLIVKNKNAGKDIKFLYNDLLIDLFPIDPYVPENWIFDCEIKDMQQLVSASNIFQQALTEQPKLMYCQCENEEIKVYRY